MLEQIYLSGTNINNNKDFVFNVLPNGELMYPNDEIFYEIDNLLVDTHDYFRTKFFGDNYFEDCAMLGLWTLNSGINPESHLDKITFERFLAESNTETTNKALLLTDIRCIITFVQERIIETKYLFEEFYKCLNNIDADCSAFETPVIFMSGGKTTPLFSLLENFFVKLYSILDLLTKLIYEKNSIYTDFSQYQKLKSREKLYGNIKYSDIYAGTIYDKDSNVNLLINLRHEIIHNGSFMYQNYLYFLFDEKKNILEKFIFLMDTDNGNFCTVKNRKKFYSQDTKLNYILPNFYFSILEKIRKTVIFINS